MLSNFMTKGQIIHPLRACSFQSLGFASIFSSESLPCYLTPCCYQAHLVGPLFVSPTLLFLLAFVVLLGDLLELFYLKEAPLIFVLFRKDSWVAQGHIRVF